MNQLKYSSSLIQDKTSIERLLNKEEYEAYSYHDVFIDVTSKGRKIKTNDYSPAGKYPIVDQSNEFIGGYIDDKDDLFENYPVIIFGDHTRCLKYLDFSFHLGADGVKVLKNKLGEEKASTRFLYYYLKNIDIPNTGYNRHFKYIKELLFVLPPLETQKEIVEILDKAQGLIDARKEQIRLMDELIQSVFYEMFGDPVTNLKGWEIGTINDLTLKTQYGTSKKAHETDGEYPVLRMNNITYSGGWDFSSLKYVDLNENELEKYLAFEGELLFNRTNSKELVGKTAVYRESKPMAYAGYLVRLKTNSKGNTEYISSYLNSKHGKATLLNMAKSIVGMANINAEELKKTKINLPPIDVQNEFARIVKKIENEKSIMYGSLNNYELEYRAIMQNAFNGKLFE